MLVTGIVVVPVAYRSIDARNNPVEPTVVLAPTEGQIVMVDTPNIDPTPLDLATVSGPLLISLRQDDASVVDNRVEVSCRNGIQTLGP